MLDKLNKMHNNTFTATLAGIVLAVIIVGGVIGYNVMQNNNRAAACEARGGTAYGHGNWLCAK